MNWLNTFYLVFIVSLRSFWVRKSFWLGTFIFALCLLILFPFSLGTAVLKRPDVQIGCLWAIMEFVAALCVARMFTIEQEADAFDILLSSRSSRSAILLAKIFFTTLVSFSLQIPILFFWFILFNVTSPVFISLLTNLGVISFFFSFGCASLGSFIYALTTRSLAKEILQPILFFPLQTAILLASVSVTMLSSSLNNLIGTWSGQTWWTILVLYPIILSSMNWIFSSILLEE